MNRLATKEMSANDKPSVVSTESAVKILVVDDKPNIVKQLTDIFSKNDWIVQSTADEAGALKICESSSFSAILISMALPADTAVNLRRKLKTNHNVLNTPVIGMIVQGDESAQKESSRLRICGLYNQTI